MQYDTFAESEKALYSFAEKEYDEAGQALQDLGQGAVCREGEKTRIMKNLRDEKGKRVNDVETMGVLYVWNKMRQRKALETMREIEQRRNDGAMHRNEGENAPKGGKTSIGGDSMEQVRKKRDEKLDRLRKKEFKAIKGVCENTLWVKGIYEGDNARREQGAIIAGIREDGSIRLDKSVLDRDVAWLIVRMKHLCEEDVNLRECGYFKRTGGRDNEIAKIAFGVNIRNAKISKYDVDTNSLPSKYQNLDRIAWGVVQRLQRS